MKIKSNKIVSFLLALLMILGGITPAFANTTIVSSKDSFTDVSSHWAREHIQWATANRYVEGYPEGEFKPENNITRAEYYTFVNRLGNYTEKSNISFADIKKDDWYYDAVSIAVKAGYLKDKNGELYPNQPISREESARILADIYKLNTTDKNLEQFKDEHEITEKGAVAALLKAGIVNGYPDGTFLPKGFLKRGEITKLFHMSVNKLGLPNKTASKNNDVILSKGNSGNSNHGDSSGGLVDRVDKVKLKTKIQELENIDLSNTTEISRENFESALNSAKYILDKNNATQTEVNDAVEKLSSAYNNLEEKPIETLKHGVIFEIKNESGEVLVDSNVVVKNSDGLLESRLDGLIDGIYSYTISHEGYQLKTGVFQINGNDEVVEIVLKGIEEEVDKTNLESAISTGENADRENKTIESIQVLDDAVSSGKEVLRDENSTQEDIDLAAKRIVDAIAGLKEEIKEYDITITTEPTDATVVVTKKGETTENAKVDGVYQLGAGDYIATVSKDGYVTQTKDFSVTDAAKTINIILEPEAIKSDDATLKSLKYGNEEITLEADRIEYAVELPVGTTEAPEVTAKATSDSANVEITPATELPGTVTITVTAEDETTKTYTINFTVAAAKVYDITITTEPTDAEVMVTKKDDVTSIEKDGNGVYQLEAGEYTATASKEGYATQTKDFTVTEDGEKEVTITLEKKVIKSNDATLKSLKYGNEEITLEADRTEYAVELPVGTTEAPEVTAETTSDSATAIVTPTTGLPGTATITVTAEDETTKTYTINFTVAAVKVYDITITTEPTDATVVVTKKGDATEIAKDASGVYKLEEGEYTVTVSNDGYVTQTKDFTVAEESSREMNITLEAEEVTPFKFTVNDEKTEITITGYETTDVPLNLVIPEKINGIPVKHIGYQAFYYTLYGSSAVKSPLNLLKLPEGIETIGTRAFAGNNFSEILIPSSMIELKDRSFMNNLNLESVTFAENSKLKMIEDYSFGATSKSMKWITEITLPENLEVIGERVFEGHKISQISLPNSLKELGAGAFGSNKIEKVTIPSGIEKLGYSGAKESFGAFWKNTNATGDMIFTQVTDLSGKATPFNVLGVVNPVSVTIKFEDENENAISSNPSMIATGMETKKPSGKGEFIDGDNHFLKDYVLGTTDYQYFNNKEPMETLAENYFSKGKEYIFIAPEILGYETPENIIKTIDSENMEVVFVYNSKNEEKPTISFKGEGITSNITAGKYIKGTPVSIKITEPTNKKLAKLLVNNEEVDPTKVGVHYEYNFTLELDTVVEVQYEEVQYEKELNIELENSKVKLGEKAKVKAFYRDIHMTFPNEDITWTLDHEDIATLDSNTGEVTALKSGTVVLTATLKDNAEVTDSVSLTIEPITVKLRVESVNETLVELQEVTIDSLKLEKGKTYYEDLIFEVPVPVLAVEKALREAGIETFDKIKFDFGSDGGWMQTIKGTNLGENGSFMYAVNHIMPNDLINQYKLKDGDYIVIFAEENWGNWEAYAYFEKEAYEIAVGEELTIPLIGVGFDMESGTSFSGKGIAGAHLLNNTKPILEGNNPVISDSSGNFKVKFSEPGTYHLSTEKLKNDENIISRAYAEVVVAQGTVSEPSHSIEYVIKDGKGEELTGASITITGSGEEINKESLQNGTYQYEVSLDGYVTKTGEFVVTDSIDTHTVNIILMKEEESTEAVVSLMIDGHTHRGLLVGDTLLQKVDGIEINVGDSVDTVIKKYFDENKIQYEKNEGYFSSIFDLKEKVYSGDSGWTYYIKDSESSEFIMPDIMMNKYKLNGGEEIKLVYSVENIIDGYEAEKKMAKEISESLMKKLDKSKMSGMTAALAYHLELEIPAEYTNVVKQRINYIDSNSTEKEYFDIILSILAIGEDPQVFAGRNLIQELGQKDMTNATVEQLVYGIAAINSAEFEMPTGSKWSKDELYNKVLEKQEEDGSFGGETAEEKVKLASIVYGLSGISSIDTKFYKLEDFLASAMNAAGGFPRDENGLSTAYVVLAMTERMKNPMNRISYRVAGEWNTKTKAAPMKALFDYYHKADNGFVHTLTDENLDEETTLIGTAAMGRANLYYNSVDFTGKSIFKFPKIASPGNEEELNRKIRKIYEETKQEFITKEELDPEPAYFLSYMGEAINETTKVALKNTFEVGNVGNAHPMYNKLLSGIAGGITKDDIKLQEFTSKINSTKYPSQTNAAKAIITWKMMDLEITEEKGQELINVLLTYGLFKDQSELGYTAKSDDAYLVAALTLIDETSEVAQAKKYAVINLQKGIAEDADMKLKNNYKKLAVALNLLGEDLSKYIATNSFDAGVKNKSILDLMLESEDRDSDMLFAATSYLSSKEGKHIYKMEFSQSVLGKIKGILSEELENYASEMPAHVLHSYDKRDISGIRDSEIQKVKDAKGVLSIKNTNNMHTIFNLMALGENPQAVEGYNLLDNIFNVSQINQKTININSLTVLSSAEFDVPTEGDNTVESIKEKVLNIREFTEITTGQYQLSDAGTALIALAPYYAEEEVKETIDKLLDKISKAMNDEGRIDPIVGDVVQENPVTSEEVAKIIQGLVHLGIDPSEDTRFIKKGNSLVDGLLSYKIGNGFKRQIHDEHVTVSSTHIAIEALIDFTLFKEGKSLVYDFRDLEFKHENSVEINPEIKSIYDNIIEQNKNRDNFVEEYEEEMAYLLGFMKEPLTKTAKSNLLKNFEEGAVGNANTMYKKMLTGLAVGVKQDHEKLQKFIEKINESEYPSQGNAIKVFLTYKMANLAIEESKAEKLQMTVLNYGLFKEKDQYSITRDDMHAVAALTLMDDSEEINIARQNATENIKFSIAEDTKNNLNKNYKVAATILNLLGEELSDYETIAITSAVKGKSILDMVLESEDRDQDMLFAVASYIAKEQGKNIFKYDI